MPDYKTILERDLERVARPAGFDLDDVARRRDRRRRNQRVTAGVVGMAVFVAAVWLVTGGRFDLARTVPEVPAATQTMTALPTPGERVGFIGLPPEGAPPSTPKRGELVLSFYGGTTRGPQARTRLRVYADGRMIWQRDADLPYGANMRSTGFLEQRLTPEGVDLLRSEALSAGPFDRDRDLSTWLDVACLNSIRIPRGGRVIQLIYRGAYDCIPKKSVPATAEETSKLRRLDARLGDPASWLPASAWEDATIRPYVPSRFAVCAGAPEAQLFSALPPAAAELLRVAGEPRDERFPHGDRYCYDLTTEEARALARSLDDAGISSTEAGALLYRNDYLSLIFEPYMPDGEHDCGCGG